MDDKTIQKFLRLTAVTLALLILIGTAAAEVVAHNDDFWYLDEANVLSDATEGVIFFANQRLYDACGAEIVVVAIDSTGGMAIDDYAYTLFNEWEIGGDTYRGLLLLMAIEDNNYYVMPGTMMGAYFDSATIGRMLDAYLEPDFAARNYDRGTLKFFEAAYAKLTDDLNLDLSIGEAKADYEAFLNQQLDAQQDAVISSNPSSELAPKNGGGGAFPVLLIMLLALIIVLRSSRGSHRSRYQQHTSSHNTSMLTGFMLGRMSANRNRYRGPVVFGKPPVNRQGRVNPSSYTRSSSAGRSGGFGGASRSGISRPSSGFGGASRSGGASRGPSTRGGGAGRFSRK